MRPFVRPARLHRRALLRGLGVAVALPGLEAMGFGASRGRALKPPKRFVVSYAGMSLGTDENPVTQVIPKSEGADYEITRGFKAIDELGIRKDVSIVSGLLIPWQEKKDGEMPPGGRSIYFHYNTLGPQVAGTNTGPTRKGMPRGPTADQVVADVIADSTVQRTLAYRVQPVPYVGGNQSSGDSGRQAWRRTPNGKVVSIEPIVSPRLAYESLFGGFVPPGVKAASSARRAVDERKSVLDLVATDTQALLGRLGQSDRERMERHFAEIRGIEKRLQPQARKQVGKSCTWPTAPEPDPAIGGAFVPQQGKGRAYSVSDGYSGEERRADVLTDLIAMAFACDLSRTSSLMITEWKCYMNMLLFGGWKSDLHELTHGAAGKQGADAVADSVSWGIRQWGKLVAKLGKLPEADGSRIIDHTAMALCFEGGHGNDPEGGRKVSAHSTENMLVLVAGHAGGLKPGRHVRATGKHPASAILSAMRAVAPSVEAIGEIHEDIPALRG